MLCIAFAASDGVCYTGGADGRVYHWTGSTLSATVEAHKGPVFAMQKVEKVSERFVCIRCTGVYEPL